VGKEEEEEAEEEEEEEEEKEEKEEEEEVIQRRSSASPCLEALLLQVALQRGQRQVDPRQHQPHHVEAGLHRRVPQRRALGTPTTNTQKWNSLPPGSLLFIHSPGHSQNVCP
jgi:hypothetical protein